MGKELVILGMHRSGTSLVTQWLHKCGLSIGTNLLAADSANRDGYFEDQDFLKLHKEILRHAHLAETGLITDTVKIDSTYLLEKMKINIELKNRLNDQWGWKDPRTCLLLPYYKQLLPAAKYLVILRPCNVVVNSLIKRDFQHMENNYLKRKSRLVRSAWKFRRNKMSRYYYNNYTEQYIKVWISYNEAILTHTALLDANDFLFIDYNMLPGSAENIFELLTKNWGFSLQHVNMSSIYKTQLVSSDETDTNAYIKDSDLLLKAQALEKELLQRCTAK